MKGKNVVLTAVALLLLVVTYQPVEAGVQVGVGVNIGLPAFSFAAPPAVAVIPGTYAYFVPDAQVDILFYEGRWYRPWRGGWYWATGYNGPWVVAGPNFVPAPLLGLRPGWRERVVIHERIPYGHFDRNWRTWQRDRYWERHHDWWQKERLEDRRDAIRDHRDAVRDRQDASRDRKDAVRDRQDAQRDRKIMEQNRQDAQRDRKIMEQNRKIMDQNRQDAQRDRKEMNKDRDRTPRDNANADRGQKQQKQRGDRNKDRD